MHKYYLFVYVTCLHIMAVLKFNSKEFLLPKRFAHTYIYPVYHIYISTYNKRNHKLIILLHFAFVIIESPFADSFMTCRKCIPRTKVKKINNRCKGKIHRNQSITTTMTTPNCIGMSSCHKE